jgi:hypothetical protein
MNSILFVLVSPSQDDAVSIPKWKNIAKKISEDEPLPSKGFQTLNEGTWLIVSNDGLPMLGRAIYQASQAGLKYKVFCFGKDAELPPSQSTP